jgi:hypothetical protein
MGILWFFILRKKKPPEPPEPPEDPGAIGESLTRTLTPLEVQIVIEKVKTFYKDGWPPCTTKAYADYIGNAINDVTLSKHDRDIILSPTTTFPAGISDQTLPGLAGFLPDEVSSEFAMFQVTGKIADSC